MAHRSIRTKHHDSVVVAAKAKLVFGANHAFGGFAAQCGLFNYQCAIAAQRVEFGSNHGNRHLLALGYIGGSADNVQPFGSPDVHLGYPQAVGIGMLAQAAYFAHDNVAQSARNCVKYLGFFNLESGCG